MTDNKAMPTPDFLELMRRREEREAKKFEREEAAAREAEENLAARTLRQEQSDKDAWQGIMEWQSRCDHRKGTSGKKKWKHVDYMVDCHTFQNGVRRIKCHKCRFRAFPGDTEKLCSYTMENFIKGVKIANPSGKSYAQWYQMAMGEDTTNTETRSEMVTQGPQPVTA